MAINDVLADLGSETTIFPQHVAKRLWKEPVTLAHHLELHYDAVMKQVPAPAPVLDSAVALYREDWREFGRANCFCPRWALTRFHRFGQLVPSLRFLVDRFFYCNFMLITATFLVVVFCFLS